MASSALPLPDSHWKIELFLSRLSSSEPTPGGGSAAALAGSLGCALGCMVSALLLSRRNVRPSEHRQLQGSRKALDRICARLKRLIREDAAAYDRLVRAQRDGSRQMLRMRREAIGCPLEICAQVVGAMEILHRLSKRTGPYLGSDVQAGQALLRGAFDAAFSMVLVNLGAKDLGPWGRRIRINLSQLQRSVERWNGNS